MEPVRRCAAEMGLLNKENPQWPGTLDAHPLVREHFRDELQKDGQRWAEGNRSLLAYYRDTAPPPPTDQAIRGEEQVTIYSWHLRLELPLLPTIQVGQILPFTLRFTADEQQSSRPLSIPLNALELAVYIEAPGFHLEGEQ